MIRRRLSALLILVGLLVMAWPAATWAYGWYWQTRLDREFAESVQAAQAEESAPDEAEWETVPASSYLPEPSPSASPQVAADTPPPAAKRKTPGTSQKSTVAAVRLRSRRVRRVVPMRDVFARLRIDRICLDAMVVEGANGAALRRGPGHLPGTGLPGDCRNCAIAAHRDAWFSRLAEVQQGDTVWVETPECQYRYVVTRKQVVTPDRGDLLQCGPEPLLTLITCTGPGYPHSRYRLLVFCQFDGCDVR